jgi:transposase
VIDWLKEASTSAVAEQFDLSWDEVDGVMQRAVARGLSRREEQRPKRLGVDETSFQKHHEYVTVISDMTRGVVVDVLEDLQTSSIDYYAATRSIYYQRRQAMVEDRSDSAGEAPEIPNYDQ